MNLQYKLLSVNKYSRASGFLAKIKPSKKGIREEIDGLIYLGCNFLEIMDGGHQVHPKNF